MVVSVLIAIFVVSMSASAFPAGVDLVRAFFINVFMTAVFSALAYWWISRFEKRQVRKQATGTASGKLARQRADMQRLAEGFTLAPLATQPPSKP